MAVGFPSVLLLQRNISKGSGAGKGRLIGFLAGAALLTATAGATGAHNDPDYAGIAITASVLGGGLVGMVTGWVIGAGIDASRWETVPVAVSPRAIPVGSLVRAYSETGRFVNGTLATPIGDSLRMKQATGLTSSVPLASLKRFEVRIGRKARSRAPLVSGFVLGLVAGGVVGALQADAEKPADPNPASKIAAGAAVGAATGWVIGVLYASHRSGEDWQEVPIESLGGQ